MPDKVMFMKAAEIIPVRRGIYKDPMKDISAFHLLVKASEEPQCDKEDCTDCPEKDSCPLFDKECGQKKPTKKAKPVRRQRKWGEDPEYDAVMRNFGMSEKPDGTPYDQHLVFGWANVTVQENGETPFDWQGDVIDTEVLEAAAYNFVLHHGLANESHQWDTECGWLVESMMFTKEKMAALGIPEGTIPEGWFVGFYIPDPDVYEKVKNGTYNMFSIEGSARRVPLDGGKEIF